MAVSDAYNAFVFLIDDIRRLKLSEPLGLNSTASADPTKLESRFSEHAKEDILANLEGFADALVPFARHLDQRDEALRQEVEAALQRFQQAVQAIPGTLRAALVSDPAAVQHAFDEGLELERLLRADVAGVLAVTVTFNDIDGD